MTRRASVVVVGAGIAGISAAYHLAVRQGIPGVVIVDPRPPLTLTSDKSTECYRNFWPNAPMVELMNRSIDIFEELALESDNVFALNRRGYLYVTARENQLREMTLSASLSSSLGAGPVRSNPAADAHRWHPDGFDVFDRDNLLDHYPFLTPRAVGALYVCRAGWLSAQQLGAWMLTKAREQGVRLIPDEVVALDLAGGSVRAVTLGSGTEMNTDMVVNAAGPMSPHIAAMAGVDLPVLAELHVKVAYKDHLAVVPRDAPMIIWSDRQTLDWSDEEREALIEEGHENVVGEMPIFCHGRPEGGPGSPYLLALWEYRGLVQEPTWPLPEDPLYPEVVMRGMTTMVPGLRPYLDRLPQSSVEGGYYSKTRENRPLIGPAGPDGFYLMSAMSGFGIMVSAAAAELLALHITDGDLPGYSDAFLLSRYEDADYLAEIERIPDSGQL